MTVEEFMNRGATIGVQIKERGWPRWNSAAYIIYQGVRNRYPVYPVFRLAVIPLH